MGAKSDNFCPFSAYFVFPPKFVDKWMGGLDGYIRVVVGIEHLTLLISL